MLININLINQYNSLNRCNIGKGLNKQIIRKLRDMLHRDNELIKLFKYAMERMPTPNYTLSLNSLSKPKTIPNGAHPGQYNIPVQNEVAVIIQDGDGGHREISLRKRDQSFSQENRDVQLGHENRDARIPLISDQFIRINELHRSYDGFQYPLVLPYGENGYDINLWKTNPNNNSTSSLSSMDYYAYRLMIRSVPNPTPGENAALFLEPRNPDEWMYDINIEYNHLLNYRNLTNQFVTDMYSKIESERLGYIQNEQKGLRADLYKVIDDAMENDTDLRTIGKRVILPSSFTGGPDICMSIPKMQWLM